MDRRLILLAVLAVPLVLPLATADHVYSHRIVVTGRVIDADGLPISGVPVALHFTGLSPGGDCFDVPARPTGPRGDFTLCRHAHEVPAGVIVNVTVAGASMERELDPALRRVSLLLRSPEPTPAHDVEGERLFARTLHATGRVMRLNDVPTTVEQVPVPAQPAGGETANVTLLAGGDVLGGADVVLDENGDYAIDLALGDVPEGARARIVVGGAEASLDLSPAYRRAHLDLVIPPPEEEVPQERPGTRTPRVPFSHALPLAALALVAALLRKR